MKKKELEKKIHKLENYISLLNKVLTIEEEYETDLIGAIKHTDNNLLNEPIIKLKKRVLIKDKFGTIIAASPYKEVEIGD